MELRTKKRYYHVCQSIAGLERLIATGKPIDWLENEDGSQASIEEICAAIVDAKAKGYEVLPPCDNVKSTGHCAGHDIPDDEEKRKGEIRKNI